ncbi:MAG: hypothetical protein EKK46_01435 [Rhodocyclaceae bacterium]|nr:MAG: hypothetical protein EKK46_01435 [Rhodocyclaceae bacterium]
MRWPQADVHEAVLSAPQANCVRVAMPEKFSRRDLPGLLAGAMEDVLLGDVAQCHLTPCSRQGGRMDVLVVDRRRIGNVVAQFEALGLPLAALYSELQSDLGAGRGWRLALSDGTALLHRPGQPRLALDAEGGGPPALLKAILATRGVTEAETPTLDVLRSSDAPANVADWQGTLEIPVAQVPMDYQWYRLGADKANLLHGGFAPARPTGLGWRPLRPALMLAVVVILAHWGVLAVQLGLQHHHLAQAEQSDVAQFQATFPGVPVMDPRAQARQQLDGLYGARGLLRSDDALALLAETSSLIGDAVGKGLKAVVYTDRRLSFRFAPLPPQGLDDLRSRLEAKGLRVMVAPAEAGDTLLTVLREVTP